MDNPILLVDDNADRTARVGTQLEAQGFSVLVANDGAEALRIAADAHPLAVVSDVFMPGIDGFELCWRLRQQDGLRETPVILTTSAANSDEGLAFAIDVGADCLVDKRLPAEALASVITDTINTRVEGGAPDAVLDEETFRRQHAALLHDLSALEAATLESERVVIGEAYEGTVRAMLTAVDATSPGFALHARRVTEYALALGVRLGIGADEDLLTLVQAATLCDIGNIQVTGGILGKRGPLSETEWRMVRRHPQFSKAFLSGIEALERVGDIVLAHHERWDGTGYPHGLRGEDIPVEARIVAVADAIDAMTAGRPYQGPRHWGAVVEELESCAGTQFDPEVVAAATKLSPAEWNEIRERAERTNPTWDDMIAGYV